jgi:hypothetical protein
LAVALYDCSAALVVAGNLYLNDNNTILIKVINQHKKSLFMGVMMQAFTDCPRQKKRI